jgi:hypothetical protein
MLRLMENKPGDVILEGYLTDASSEEQDEARRRLYAFFDVLLRIAVRIEREAQLPDSRNSRRRPTLEGTHFNV